MERGFAVHALNPKQLDRFRDRFSGAKDDRRDARVLELPADLRLLDEPADEVETRTIRGLNSVVGLGYADLSHGR